MLKFISRQILTGLITILPVVITLYLLYWFVVSAETALADVMRLVLPANYYLPGMGVAAGLVVVFLVGLLMNAYLVRKLFQMGEQLIYRMPLIKSVYGAMRDFFAFFSPSAKKEFEQVVSVRLGELELIGFITQAVPEKLPDGFRQGDNLLVYLPMSYNIGGYTALIPRHLVRPLDMKMEDAMRFTLTAGVTGAQQKD